MEDPCGYCPRNQTPKTPRQPTLPGRFRVLVANQLCGTSVFREVPARAPATRQVDLPPGYRGGAKEAVPPMALKELDVKYAAKRNRD